jgi:flagellin
MALSVNTNVAALNTYRSLSTTQGEQAKSLEKLSSGFRINRAADDAAGLAISEGMRSQMGGIKVGTRNAQDGISVVQTAEGALNETTSILQRVRDLTVQGGNLGSLTEDASKNIQEEITKLTSTLDDIANNTKFNGQSLLDGSYTDKSFQVGANASDKVTVAIGDMTASALGVDASSLAQLGVVSSPAVAAVAAVADDAATTGVDESAPAVAAKAAVVGTSTADIDDNLKAIDAAISKVSTERAKLGATQNQLDHVINNNNVALENVTASESRIRDTDMASEMVNFTRTQILSQAGTAMLAQAKSIPQGVLSLLQ